VADLFLDAAPSNGIGDTLFRSDKVERLVCLVALLSQRLLSSITTDLILQPPFPSTFIHSALASFKTTLKSHIPSSMADREAPYDPYIPAGGAAPAAGSTQNGGNQRTAALQAVSVL
jgi:hypothetical protein